jgi:perosamine synthetase
MTPRPVGQTRSERRYTRLAVFGRPNRQEAHRHDRPGSNDRRPGTGRPARDRGMIPVARPDIGPDEIAAVTDVLQSANLAGGRQVAELEARWAAFIGTKYAIAVSNGTVALMCLYQGLGLGPGDEVITVGHTFNATVSSILSTGATPVFVDIEPDTYVMDARLIEAAITPRTRAICPVHLFGLPADLDTIVAIAERHGLAIVEDACQAHGAEFRGRRVGSFGHGAFSLYATKNMTTGEGGLITTDDSRLADWIRLYRNQGMREPHHHEILGYNFRLTDIAAAIGLCQLDKLEANTARRQAIAARYDASFADLPIETPVTPVGRTHVFHQYTIAVKEDRDGIVADLAAGGIGTGIYYPVPLHRQPYVLERGIQADLPMTDRASLMTLSLPLFPGLTDEDQTTVITAVRASVERRASGGTAPAIGHTHEGAIAR